MIESITLTNLNSEDIDLNEEDGPYPVLNYEVEIDSRIEQRPKSMDDGLWPTFNYEGAMIITIEGAILADDADDYQAKRYALSSKLRYKPGPRTRRSGILYVEYSGESEVWKCDYSLQKLSMLRSSSSPNFGPYRIELLSWTPYFVGVDSDAFYYDD